MVSVEEKGTVVRESHHQKVVISLSEIVADAEIAGNIAKTTIVEK
jgi:hypothetical protein